MFRFAHNLPLFRNVNLLKHCKRKVIKHKSTASTGIGINVSSKEDTKPVETAHDDDGIHMGKAQTSESSKLPAREPLVKNFFVGVVDKELLAYPEIVTREELKALQNEIVPVKNFFTEQIDVSSIDAKREVPEELINDIRNLGLYNFNIPYKYYGKGWNWSQSLLVSEPETNSVDIAMSLLSHRVIIDLLNELGTEEQKQRYFQEMGNGNLVATEAIYEYDAPEDDFFNTTAEFDSSNNTWILNGAKSFVVTGPVPKNSQLLLLVIAQTQHLNTTNSTGDTTIFLVDGTLSGVTLDSQHQTIGCRGTEMRSVRFEKVIVPENCIIGEPHQGNKAADILLRANRLRSALIGLGLSKNILNNMTEYSIYTKQCGTSLMDMELTRIHLSKGMCATYAMESMIYLTAGLLDEFESPDVSLEAAITKYYTMKELSALAAKWVDIKGPKSLHSGQLTEITYRNAAQLYTQGESIDSLKLAIALLGLQHSGKLMQENVRMSRNPLFHPGHIFSKFLQNSNIDNPKTKMRLGDNLHPTLEPAAQCIEHSVARLQMCVELVLTRYGSGVIGRHNEMQRLAEMATIIYSMFASVARSSRSYCIGLSLADNELLTASSICSHGRDVVQILSKEIFNGQYLNNDINFLRLSNQITKSKGYFATHPLTYNF